MNTITHITKIARSHATTLLKSGVLSAFVIMALFMLEAAPVRFATESALAWECTIEAVTEYSAEGTIVTLSWNAAADTDSLTIEQLEGQVFGRTGSVQTVIHEPTTFVAHTHVDYTDDTMSCAVHVEPATAPTNTCESVDLSIHETSFTWAGPPALSHYTAYFCDGTSSGKVEESWSDVETVEFNKQLSSVSGKGGQCSTTVERTCVSDRTGRSCMSVHS